MPASTSGNFHTELSLGDGELVRHAEVVVWIAIELFRDNVFNTFEFCKKTQDLIIMALFLHDRFKQGMVHSGRTLFKHSLLAAQFVFDNITKLPMNQLNVL